MPDKPIHEEFGVPMSQSPVSSDEVFRTRYGAYKEQAPALNPAAPPPPAQPQPFGPTK